MHLSDIIATWLTDQQLPYEVVSLKTAFWSGSARIRRKGKLYNAEHSAIAHVYDTYVMLWSVDGGDLPLLRAFNPDFFVILAAHITCHEVRYKSMEKEARENTYKAWVKNVRNSSWIERLLRAAKHLFAR